MKYLETLLPAELKALLASLYISIKHFQVYKTKSKRYLALAMTTLILIGEIHDKKMIMFL